MTRPRSPSAASWAAGLAILATSCAPSDAHVVTLAEYFALGEARTEAFLAAGSTEEVRALAKVRDRARDAVVRVRVNYGRTETSFQSDHGTGVLVDGGRVALTAGHVLAVLDREPEAEIVLIRTDGRTLQARPIHRSYSGRAGEGEDLAALEVLPEPMTPAPDALERGDLRTGSLVLVLGYSGRMGRDPTGAVTGDDAAKHEPLQPLSCVGRVTEDGGIEPVAGCIPEGGMSGGPVVDAQGRVVAIETSVTRRHDGPELGYTIRCTPLPE